MADLSFISLTLVLAPLAACTEPGGDLVLMVKPQFEIGKDRLGRTGVVTSERERRLAVGKVAAAAMDTGLELKGLAQQPAARPGRKRRVLPVDKTRDSEQSCLRSKSGTQPLLRCSEQSGRTTSSTRRRNPMSRRVLILAHTGREESLKAAWEACARLHDAGIVPVMLETSSATWSASSDASTSPSRSSTTT